MNKTYKPLGSNILVKPIEQKTVTEGGFELPDAAKEQPKEGKVIAVGEGKFAGYNDAGNALYEPMKVREGDIVLYKKWGGQEIKINNEEHMILNQDDILSIVKE